MRKTIYQAWKNVIEQEMNRSFPAFKEIKRTAGEPLKGLKHEWASRGALKFYLFFRVVYVGGEGFDVTVGWTTRKKIKMVTGDASSNIWDFEQESMDAPLIFVIGAGGVDGWSFWEPEEGLLDDPINFGRQFAEFYTKQLTQDEAKEIVTSCILDAMDKIEKHVIPYFEKVAANKNERNI